MRSALCQSHSLSWTFFFPPKWLRRVPGPGSSDPYKQEVTPLSRGAPRYAPSPRQQHGLGQATQLLQGMVSSSVK